MGWFLLAISLNRLVFWLFFLKEFWLVCFFFKFSSVEEMKKNLLGLKCWSVKRDSFSSAVSFRRPLRNLPRDLPHPVTSTRALIANLAAGNWKKVGGKTPTFQEVGWKILEG